MIHNKSGMESVHRPRLRHFAVEDEAGVAACVGGVCARFHPLDFPHLTNPTTLFF